MLPQFMVVTVGNGDPCDGKLFDPAMCSVTFTEKIIKAKGRRKKKKYTEVERQHLDEQTSVFSGKKGTQFIFLMFAYKHL